MIEIRIPYDSIRYDTVRYDTIHSEGIVPNEPTVKKKTRSGVTVKKENV
jgi:hypothetical protein